MPTNSREKCRLCAKLSAQQAQQLHGLEGDACWIPQRCYKRRTYYRHRDDYNRKRRQIYRTDTQNTTQTVTVTHGSRRYFEDCPDLRIPL